MISDKDRIATSKTPQINREDLKKILQSMHPGQPGANVHATAGAEPAAAAGAENQQPAPAPQENSQGFIRSSRRAIRRRELQTPPQEAGRQPNFNAQMTAGSAIEQAERAAAENRGHYGGLGKRAITV